MQEFPFVATAGAAGMKSLLPFLPIELSLRDQSIATSALIDSGATVNVLPHSVGLSLGAIWENQPVPFTCRVTFRDQKHGR